MRIRSEAPPIEDQIAQMAEGLEMSEVDVAVALVRALERPVIEPLAVKGP